jgi:hypothetical protein
MGRSNSSPGLRHAFQNWELTTHSCDELPDIWEHPKVNATHAITVKHVRYRHTIGAQEMKVEPGWISKNYISPRSTLLMRGQIMAELQPVIFKEVSVIEESVEAQGSE